MSETQPTYDGPQPPIALAMLLCDGLHVDPGTGKKTILGIFTSVGSMVYPFKLPQFVVFVSLTDGRGKMPVEVRVVKMAIEIDDPDTTVASTKLEMPVEDPLAVIDFAMVLQGVEFPEPGEYRVQLWACGEYIISRRIMAIMPQPPEAE